MICVCEAASTCFVTGNSSRPEKPANGPFRVARFAGAVGRRE